MPSVPIVGENILQKLGITFISKERKLTFRNYEEFIVNFLLETLSTIGFFPLNKYIGVNYVISPKFTKRRGVRISRIPIENLRVWLSPSLILKHNFTGSLLSMYYDGYPLVRTKLRPDITIISGEILTKIQPISKIETIINVFWRSKFEDRFEKIGSFSSIVNDFGPEPVEEIRTIKPLLIIDPTIRKRKETLEKQIEKYFRVFQPKSIIVFSKNKLSSLEEIQIDSLFIFDEFDEAKKDFMDKKHLFLSLLKSLLKSLLNS